MMHSVIDLDDGKSFHEMFATNDGGCNNNADVIPCDDGALDTTSMFHSSIQSLGSWRDPNEKNNDNDSTSMMLCLLDDLQEEEQSINNEVAATAKTTITCNNDLMEPSFSLLQDGHQDIQSSAATFNCYSRHQEQQQPQQQRPMTPPTMMTSTSSANITNESSEHSTVSYDDEAEYSPSTAEELDLQYKKTLRQLQKSMRRSEQTRHQVRRIRGKLNAMSMRKIKQLLKHQKQRQQQQRQQEQLLQIQKQQRSHDPTLYSSFDERQHEGNEYSFMMGSSERSDSSSSSDFMAEDNYSMQQITQVFDI